MQEAITTVGILDEFRASFGEDALKPSTDANANRQAWQPLCVCGHVGRFHSSSIGGDWVLTPTVEKTGPGGRRLVISQTFHGCRGAMVNKGQVTIIETRDRESDPMTQNQEYLATCPCDEMRPVGRVDRPNRYFNQRIPTDRKDPLRHPMMVGIRALTTFLSRRKQAIADPEWADAEFDRRFEWTARWCAISSCKQTDDVWPVYINTDEPLISELRCAKHRP